MRVLLIDDHALFRAGLTGLLERRNIEVAAAVGDGEEGLRLAQELKPDVVLLDLRMPDMNGLEVLRRLQESAAAVPVVMLTTSDEEQDLVESLRLGAKGYLLKDMAPDELVSTLRGIVSGKIIVTPQLTSVLAKVVQQGESAGIDKLAKPFADLTPREREILCQLSEGRSNKMIARKLGISDGTVKLHVKAILRKLGVHSRVEAAVMAVEQGLSQKSQPQS
jgi:two-component system nitrate/nitrite response regulator NarL